MAQNDGALGLFNRFRESGGNLMTLGIWKGEDGFYHGSHTISQSISGLVNVVPRVGQGRPKCHRSDPGR